MPRGYLRPEDGHSSRKGSPSALAVCAGGLPESSAKPIVRGPGSRSAAAQPWRARDPSTQLVEAAERASAHLARVNGWSAPEVPNRSDQHSLTRAGMASASARVARLGLCARVPGLTLMV